MSEVPSERTLERIRKMLALADGQANPNESATAATMADKLMLRYGLDRAAVMGESITAPDVAARDHAGVHDSDTDWGIEPEPPASKDPTPRAWYRGASAAWVACAVAGIAISIGVTVVRGISPATDEHQIEDAVVHLLTRLDGTSAGAMRAIREHVPATSASRPSHEEMTRLLAATNRNLPVQVDEVTWVKNVRATHDAIVYEFEIRDRYVADVMRQLGSEELKLMIAQSAAEMGADVCAPIEQSNRHFQIRSDYVDVNASLINSFSYARGECVVAR
jgi:hypothetical protein